MPSNKVAPSDIGEETNDQKLGNSISINPSEFFAVAPGEKFVTLDLERDATPATGGLPNTASRNSMGMQTQTLNKALAGTVEDNDLHVRSFFCVCSTFASGAEGRPDNATEELFATIKYRHFLGAFMQTSFLMPLGALGQASWAALELYWARAGLLTGIVAPMYLVYAYLVFRHERWYLRLSGTLAEKILIACLCFQSMAIVAAEFMRPQLDYGMLVMHIGFVHNFSPLGEMAIHLVTAGFGLVPYILLKVYRILQSNEGPAEITLFEPTAEEAYTMCGRDHISDTTQLLEILMPTVILLYQSVVTMRRFRSMRIDLLTGCILHKQRTRLKNERAKCEGLLTSMLPRQIIGALKDNEPIDPQAFNDVTVLFIQICDFQTLCSNFLKRPEAIVEVLNTLFSEFDRLSDILDVYKVETVCDVYMAVVGCPQPIVNHADVAAHFALAVQESMKHLRIRIAASEFNNMQAEARDRESPSMSLRQLTEGGHLEVRIGLNSGRLRAGVVGLECPRYKLVGDTVNTASRMESTCLPGRIQLSASTRDKLTAGVFDLEDRGEIQVKGKGTMRTAFLSGYADGAGMQNRRILIEHGSDDDQDNGDPFGSANSELTHGGQTSPFGVNAPLRVRNHARWREDFNRYGVFNISETPGESGSHLRNHFLPNSEERQSCGCTSVERLHMLFLLVPPSQKQPEWIETLRRDKPIFMEDTLQKRVASARNLTIIWLIVLAAVSMIDVALDVLEDGVHVYRMAILFRAVGNYIIGLLYLLLITNEKLFRKYAQILTLSMLAAQGIALLGCGHIVYNSDPAIIAIFGAYVLFYKVITISQRLTLCALAVLGYVLFELFSCDNGFAVPTEIGRNIGFLLIFFIFMACGVRLEEHLEHVAHFEQRKATSHLREIDRARAASSGLLENLLPRHVVDLVADGVSPIAEHFDNVTIMFTDIKGFTVLSSQISPHELVDLLNSMYSAFDEIIVNWALYKVEIIGDAYFVSAGCPPSPHMEGLEADHWAMRAVEVGLALQRALARVTEDDSLQMRVGLHTGSVVAGVVGKKGPRYHLFGSSVGYANKMESSGIPGKLHISDATYSLLVQGGHEYDFQEQTLEIEGETEMQKTYLVTKSKSKAALRMQKEIIQQRRASGRAARASAPAPRDNLGEAGRAAMAQIVSG